MTPLDRALIEAFVASFPYQAPILEIGSRLIQPESGTSTDLRVLFPHTQYIGTDFQHGAGVDCVMNASQLAIRTATIGTVLTVSTLEHIWNIQETFAHIWRVLNEHGVVILTSHMDKSIHAYPSDYWRFTPEAIARLLAPFTARLIGFQGRANHPVNVFGVGFKKPPHDFANRAKIFRRDVEQAMQAHPQSAPLTVKLQRLRRLALWRLFGPKSSYRALRDEHTIGWHCFPD